MAMGVETITDKFIPGTPEGIQTTRAIVTFAIASVYEAFDPLLVWCMYMCMWWPLVPLCFSLIEDLVYICRDCRRAHRDPHMPSVTVSCELDSWLALSPCRVRLTPRRLAAVRSGDGGRASVRSRHFICHV